MRKPVRRWLNDVLCLTFLCTMLQRARTFWDICVRTLVHDCRLASHPAEVFCFLLLMGEEESATEATRTDAPAKGDYSAEVSRETSKLGLGLGLGSVPHSIA